VQVRSRAFRRVLHVLVFAVGAAGLGTEIAVARLIAPFFGASTIVWANTIAVVLLALSVGYWVGGHLADRHPDLPSLSRLVLGAASLLATVPLVGHPFLNLSLKAFDTLSVGVFAGSLSAVLILVAVPIALMGAVSPWAIRLSLGGVASSGTTAGRLYALSTAGSLVGVFSASLLLIPWAGTRRTFLVFALLLALAALPGLRRAWGAAVAAAIAVLLALPPGAIKPATSAGGRVIAEAETPYQYARVVQYPGGERQLELDEGQAVHSEYLPGTLLTGNYWDDFLVVPFLSSSAPARRVAILGDAAGTTARAYTSLFPGATVDGVEIDGQLTRLGERWFGLRPSAHLHLITADARPFLRQAGGRYDLIVLDAYRQPYIPFYLVTREFFALIRARLAPGGVVAVNVGHVPGSEALTRAVAATMATAFPHVLRDTVDATNEILIGAAGSLGPDRLAAASPRLPPALQPLASTVASRLGPAPGGGPVWTDDNAPVEWLIDRSIISYAAHPGAAR
jgi:spermidine synthase